MIERGPVLNTNTAADLLKSVGIDANYLSALIRYGIIKPSREQKKGKPRNWRPEEIFKAYACKILERKYLEEHQSQNNGNGIVLQSIGRLIPHLKFGRYKEFTSREDWRKVTEDARKMGIDFGVTMYAFVPGQG